MMHKQIRSAADVEALVLKTEALLKAAARDPARPAEFRRRCREWSRIMPIPASDESMQRRARETRILVDFCCVVRVLLDNWTTETDPRRWPLPAESEDDPIVGSPMPPLATTPDLGHGYFDAVEMADAAYGRLDVALLDYDERLADLDNVVRRSSLRVIHGGKS